MKRISRRKFLSLLAKSAGSAAVFQVLNACGINPVEEPATPTKTPFGPAGPQGDGTGTITGTAGPAETPTPTETPAPTEVPATETLTPGAEPAYLAVARGGNDPEALVRSAVDAIGGIGRFVPAGANVLVKPNICVASHRYELAATTNPWVVGALVKMCYEAGAGRVRVYDFPFSGSYANAYVDSGIAEQVAAAGGEMEYVDQRKFTAIQLPNAQSLGSASFYSEVIDADVVINVPIAKHHSGAGLTLGMKNMMGVILNRSAIHGDMHRRIADLADFIRPELTVVDAVRIRIANGPAGTSLNDVRKMDTVVASADIVAADAYAASRILALYLPTWSDPNRLGYIKNGAARGLGRSDLENLKIEEISVGA